MLIVIMQAWTECGLQSAFTCSTSGIVAQLASDSVHWQWFGSGVIQLFVDILSSVMAALLGNCESHSTIHNTANIANVVVSACSGGVGTAHGGAGAIAVVVYSTAGGCNDNLRSFSNVSTCDKLETNLLVFDKGFVC